MMDPILNAKDVIVGFHPAGYRIDKKSFANEQVYKMGYSAR